MPSNQSTEAGVEVASGAKVGVGLIAGVGGISVGAGVGVTGMGKNGVAVGVAFAETPTNSAGMAVFCCATGAIDCANPGVPQAASSRESMPKINRLREFIVSIVSKLVFYIKRAIFVPAQHASA
jgi:hypothetical protein